VFAPFWPALFAALLLNQQGHDGPDLNPRSRGARGFPPASQPSRRYHHRAECAPTGRRARPSRPRLGDLDASGIAAVGYTARLWWSGFTRRVRSPRASAGQPSGWSFG